MLCFSSTTIFLVTAGSCGEIREIYGGYSRAREAENSRYFLGYNPSARAGYLSSQKPRAITLCAQLRVLHLPQTTRIINRHGVARGQTLCQEAVQLNLILILNAGLTRGIRHNRRNTRAVNPWPRLASHGTPPCATRDVDMLSRWEHAQRPGGTRESPSRTTRPSPEHATDRQHTNKGPEGARGAGSGLGGVRRPACRHG